MEEKPRIMVVVGPTASGKTDLGIKSAQERSGAVVSTDSRQVYAGMDIGTAKPREAWGANPHDIFDADTVEGVPHYLLNIREPDTPITLADWQKAAFAAMDHIISSGKQPILVGGTMLYVDSVMYNYAIPSVPPNQELRARLEQLPADELYQQLLAKDPAVKEFIEPGNKRRIIRALEVMEATNQPFSALRQQHVSPYTFEVIGIFPGWDGLRDRITTRAQHMLDEGLLDETGLLRKKYGSNLPLLQTMNYKEAGLILDGNATKKEALEHMVRVNMRYARRQMSWWRNRKEIRWIEP